MKLITLKNKRLTQIGGSYGFIVDAAFINNKLIDKDKVYDVTLQEKTKGDSN